MSIRRVLSRRDNKHVWQIDVTIAGTRIRHSGFQTKDEADRALQEMKLRARSAKYNLPFDSQITLRDLLRERRDDRSISSKRVDVFEKFVESVGPTTRIRDIARSDLIGYQKMLLECAGPAP